MCHLNRINIVGLHSHGILGLHGRTIIWLQTVINIMLSNTSALVGSVSPLIKTKLQNIKFIDNIEHDCIILLIKDNVD
jgi:hypothetical protein